SHPKDSEIAYLEPQAKSSGVHHDLTGVVGTELLSSDRGLHQDQPPESLEAVVACNDGLEDVSVELEVSVVGGHLHLVGNAAPDVHQIDPLAEVLGDAELGYKGPRISAADSDLPGPRDGV